MNRILICFLMFLIYFTISCKKDSASITQPSEQMYQLKVLVDGDASVSGILLATEENISEQLSSGINLKYGTVVELTAMPYNSVAILWTGGDIIDTDRRNTVVSFKVTRDTVITLKVGTSASPIEIVTLDLMLSDNGVVLVNGDKRSVSAKILFAKNQVLELEAKANNSYYFVSWDGNDINSIEEDYTLIMNNDKAIVASFKSSSLGKKLKLKIRGGFITVNGTTYTEDTELTFNKGATINVSAQTTSDENNTFAGWGGDVSSQNQDKSSISFKLTSDMFLEPKFGNKTGALFLSFNPPDMGVKVSYTLTSDTGTSMGVLSDTSDVLTGLKSGDIITLTVNTPPSGGYKTGATWSGGTSTGGAGVSTTLVFYSASQVVSVSFAPLKYYLTIHVNRKIDAGLPTEILETTDLVRGYSISVDGVVYNGITSFTKAFDANSKFNISLNAGLHYTNISLNGSAETNIEYNILDPSSSLEVILGHVSRSLSLTINDAEREINGKKYISHITVSGTGYSSSDTSYDPTANPNNIKVLSGYEIKFSALPSGGHIFNNYTGLDITNENIGYFTNASWDKVIEAKFSPSDVWDGKLVTEPDTTDSGNTYIINVPSELAWIANKSAGGDSFVGKTIEISQELDMNDRPFIGIATGNANNSFDGTFDGKGYKIKNLSVTAGTKVGLIGKTHANAVVKNVYVSSGIISISGGDSIGAIVGSNYMGTVMNSTNNATVNGSYGTYIGGIVGYNAMGTVETSYNSASISGFNSTGGIVGYNHEGVVKNVGNEGKILAKEGGNCNFFGGIVGRNNSGTIELAYNSADIKITNSYYAGGIVGENRGNKATISKVYNSGNIDIFSSSQGVIFEYVGGIVGYDVDTIAQAGVGGNGIQNSYNTGTISGLRSIGGIAGAVVSSANWDSVYSIGRVVTRIPSTKPGGVIGEARSSVTLINVYYIQNQSINSSMPAVGGVIGSSIIAGGTPIADTTKITVSGMNLSTAIWEDKTPAKDINKVKTRAMIIGLGEYNNY